MPIHILGSLAETTSISPALLIAATCLVALLLVIKTVWVEGRRNTWDRDWAGKFIIVVAPPSPLVYALLDHLVNRPHPPQILYLPPIASPLPQQLLTILHAIRLSAHTTDKATATPVLHCEPLPRTPLAVRDFIRKWAVKPPGTGDDGRRIDGIIWADEWEVSRPWKMYRARGAGAGEEQGRGDTWAGVRKSDEYTTEQAKFHLMHSLLPFLLRAPMDRSIRLINVLSPLYSAAIPRLQSVAGAAEQEPSSSSSSSPVVESGKKAVRGLLVWARLQKVVDALASVAHNQAGKEVPVPVPAVDEESTTTTTATQEESPQGARRRVPADPATAEFTPARRITVQSNILALPVVIGFNRWGIVRPLLGMREGSILGWTLYLLFAPLIYLVTPSTDSALQSILYALSAPVLYDDDDAVAQTTEGKAVASKVRRDGVRGGGIIRDASWIPNPFATAWADPLAGKIWDTLEAQVEERVKAAEAEAGKDTAERTGEGKNGVVE